MEFQEDQIQSPAQKLILRTLAESVAKPGSKFLEVGSWCGDSTMEIGSVVKEKGGILFCVDWWKGSMDTYLEKVAMTGDVFSYFWNRIRRAGLEDVVVPIRANSGVAHQALIREGFDFVFIDGDHRYEGVSNDIKNYAPLVKKGGILCGHDCEGRLEDYDAEFLAAGKDVDCMESVHCGVVLAVNSVFDDFSLNHSIWSVRLPLDGGKWTPAGVEFPGLNYKRQLAPPPIGSTRNYILLRYGSFVYALPHNAANIDITEETVRDAEGVLKGKTMHEVEGLTGEKIVYTPLPSFLGSYRTYNFIQFKGVFYAIAQSLGALDMNNLTDAEIRRFRNEKSMIAAESLLEAKFLVSKMFCEELEKDVLERDEKIESLKEELKQGNAIERNPPFIG